MKNKTCAIYVPALATLSFVVYACVTSYNRTALLRDSLMTENIEALSDSEDNKYNFANQIVASVKAREGICYICTVQYTYEQNGRTYRHFKNTETCNTWKKCMSVIVPKDDARAKENCKYKLCPGSQSEGPIEEDWPL